jgi:hypothetical protein
MSSVTLRLALFAAALLAAVGLSASVASADACACGGHGPLVWHMHTYHYPTVTNECHYSDGYVARFDSEYAYCP